MDATQIQPVISVQMSVKVLIFPENHNKPYFAQEKYILSAQTLHNHP